MRHQPQEKLLLKHQPQEKLLLRHQPQEKLQLKHQPQEKLLLKHQPLRSQSQLVAGRGLEDIKETGKGRGVEENGKEKDPGEKRKAKARLELFQISEALRTSVK
ncbi:hypothetical protein ACROYT_G017161 [Oculina patagonica]